MRKRVLLFPLLVLTLSSVSFRPFSNKIDVLYADETVDNVKIGDTFFVEQKTLIYNDESKVVDGQIILPDGTSKEGKYFTIEMPGIYTVNYRAFFGTHEESLSIFYHCHRNSGDFFISSEKSNPANAGVYSHQLQNGEIKGARLTLDSKTTFTYDGEIDFNSFGQENPFIEFIVDTSKQSTSDIETITVRLTDTNNSNNYVDINVTDSGPIDDDGRGCYILAGSNSQFKTGYESATLHTSKYGTNVGSSFRNLPEKKNKPLSLYFDYPNKTLHVSPIINTTVKRKITDLDDKSVYGSNIWEGFTNGKAKLSIFASSLINSEANIIITKVGNVDLSPLDFVDLEAPTIQIDFAEQSKSNVPKASINRPYKIFDAKVIDNYDKNLSYLTYVTFSDTTNGKVKDVSVVNGYFTPKEVGKYTITYIAKDHSNNIGKQTLQINTIDSEQTMSLSDLTPISGQLYSEIAIPSTSEVSESIVGGSGKAIVTRTIKDSNNNEIVIEKDTFVPTRVGDYTVHYDAVDYIGNTASSNLIVHATDPGHPIFIGDIELPKVVIKGHKYSLPSYSGVEVVSNETISLDSKVYVNDVLLSDSTFIAGDVCNVKYVLTGQRGTENYERTITVVDPGEPLNLANYFVGDFEKTVNTNDVTLSATSGTKTALFASVLPYDNPYVKFSINRSLNNFDELIFKFSDSLNSYNSLSFVITFSSEKTYVSAGNSTEKYEIGMVQTDDEETYAIDFLSSQKVLKDINHKEITLTKFNDQGKAFEGFAGGVYLEISMTNIIAASEVKIVAISNQTLGHLDFDPYYDFINPVIIFKEKFINEQQYGEDAYITAVDVFDVLSDVTATVTVKAPDGSYKLKNADATKVNTFKLDQFGSYLVTYKGSDGLNSASYPRKIVVYDFNAPELTITGSLNETYKLNDAISIPSYSVSDNLNDYKLDIFLIMPNNEERMLMSDTNGKVTSYLDSSSMVYNESFKVNSTTFKAEQYGNYTMRFVAYDSDYNKVVKELHFIVK